MVPKFFILDVDGVMTTGCFLYDSSGKCYKVFGPDDNDALSLLKDKLEIIFVSGDKKGFPISKKRISDDMGYPIHLVSTINRVEWLEKKFNLKEIIYMGDGIFDHLVMNKVGYGIAPFNADDLAKEKANYVTKRKGGERAVSEACIHIIKNFFGGTSKDQIINEKFNSISQLWVG